MNKRFYVKKTPAVKRRNLRLPVWIAVCLCGLLFASCAPAGQGAATPRPTAPAASPDVPASQPSAAPRDGLVRLGPGEFLDVLYENRMYMDETTTGVFSVHCDRIAEILADRGERALSSILTENRDAYVAMRFQPDTLYYQGRYGTSEGGMEYAAIVMNNHRSGYCLLFENDGEWRLADYIPCGEVEQALTVQTAEDERHGVQTWLVIPGVIASGSSMGTDNCLWYNLATKAVELDYIPSMGRFQGGTPLQYDMRGTAKLKPAEDGGLVFSVTYDYVFGNEAFFAEPSGKKGVSISVSETQASAWEPGSYFRPESYGRSLAMEPHELSVHDTYAICGNELDRMRHGGSEAEQAWTNALAAEFDREANAYILISPPGTEGLVVSRYAGYAPAPRLDYFELTPALTVRPGTELRIEFFSGYIEPYRLTRYDPETGEGSPIPTLNNRFAADAGEGTALYTLEFETFSGLHSYDFAVTTSIEAPEPPLQGESADGRTQAVFGAMTEEEAIARGFQYVRELTGNSLEELTASVHAELREGRDATPDEWDIDYSFHERPRMQINLRMVAQSGNLTFYASFYNGGTGMGETAALPFAGPPEGTAELDMKELARYYYTMLPVDDQGELKRIEYKREVKNEDGSVTTQIYLRFKSDNVFAIDLDQATKRPVWICMYYK